MLNGSMFSPKILNKSFALVTHPVGSDSKKKHRPERQWVVSCFESNSFCPLDQQVEFLLKERHVYLFPGGCFNTSAINSGNLDYLAESLHLTLTTQP